MSYLGDDILLCCHSAIGHGVGFKGDDRFKADNFVCAGSLYIIS